MAPKKLFAIDAMAMAFRSFYAFMGRPLKTSSGFNSSALFGTAMSLMKIIEEEKPHYMVIATDSKEKTFRHHLYPEYKANRGEMPEELAEQLPYLFDLFNAFGFKLYKQHGFEADDLIGTIVNQSYALDNAIENYIVSGDKDFMQLINDKIFLYTPKTAKNIEILGNEQVESKFGVPPGQVRDVLALMGDSSDNVPGVKGIGKKGALELIKTFGSLENIYDNLDSVQNKRQKNALISHQEMALLSQKLVTIDTNCPLTIKLEEFSINWKETVSRQELLDYYEKWEFKQLGNRVTIHRNEQEKSPENAYNVSRPDRKYKLVNTVESLKDFLNHLERQTLFAFDTETTGLDIISDKPIGISISTEEKTAYYIPLIEQHLEDIKPDDIVKQVKTIFINKETRKIAHNLKFDMQMLKNIGVSIEGPVGDTMIAAFLCDSESSSYKLDTLCEDFLAIKKIAIEALIGKDKKKSMTEVDIDLLYYYACEDADCCLRLHNYFEKIIVEKELVKLYDEIEIPVIEILSSIEKFGIAVDVKALKSLSLLFAGQIDEIEKEIFQISGQRFNINSPKQLQKVLFEDLKIHEKLGISSIKKSKQGYSTDVSVLESLAAHPLPQKILTYRSIAKLKSTYTDALQQMIHNKTGRIHTSFHQTGTATGRLSSSHPNLQNIPIRSTAGQKIRSAFIAAPQYKLLSADYSQIELRLLAHLSGDDQLIQAFLDGGDIHRKTASTILGVSPDQIDSEARSRAKAINYGIVYGMGAKKLAQTTGMTVESAREFIDKYFEQFPGVKQYLQSCVEFAQEHGYSRTLTGRRRPIRGFQEGGRALAFASNIAVNSPLQGSAADLIKIAMINTQRRCLKEGLELKMLLQVHDELLFEYLPSEEEQAIHIVREEMESAMKLRVPLITSIGTGNNWLEAHS